MKMTKKELEILIESYLADEMLNERLKVIDDTGYEVPKCDFQFNPKFLEFIDFVKAGGKRPAYKGADIDKPYLFNPLLRDALTTSLLPFMNLLVVPTFGIKTKCDTMRKMQAMFNDMYTEFESGFEGAPYKGSGAGAADDGDDDDTSKLNAEITKASNSLFSNLAPIMSRKGLVLPSEKDSNLLNTSTGRSEKSGFSYGELLYASMLLGNLRKARSDNRRSVEAIFNKFNTDADKADSVNSLMNMSRESKNIPGYDKIQLYTLFDEIVSVMAKPEDGPRTLALITKKLFKKLRGTGII